MPEGRDPLAGLLERRAVVMLDGGLATELERRGADLNDPLWSAKVLVETPDLIRDVHLDYFASGADVAVTASYQATFEGFARRGIARDDAAAILRSSVRLAREARDRFLDDVGAESPGTQEIVQPLIAASIGCYGASLADGSEYRGDYGLSLPQLIDFHRPRLEVLADAGADLLACETIPCQIEAEALVSVLEDVASVPAWISFSCADERHVRHGELFSECVAIAAQSGQVAAVGVNCTAPGVVTPLIETAAQVTDKPIVCYPNSGELWDATTKQWTGSGEEDIAALAFAWFNAGARLIGGCCRTTPATIRAMKDALQDEQPVP